MHTLAFAMGTHAQLGSATSKAAAAGGGSLRDCEYVTMPGELVQWVGEACVSWPEGRAGELEGMV